MMKETELIENNLLIVKDYVIENNINIEDLKDNDIKPLMHIF